MIPTEAMKVFAETKTKPGRTGRCQPSENPTALARTMPFRSKDTATAAMNAETSHKAGEQGFVNTIFRLRLRRCEDNDKQSQTPGKERSNPLRSEKISRN